MRHTLDYLIIIADSMKVIALGSGNCPLAGPKLLFGGHSSKSLP